jgi:hypothetical protein
MQHRKLTLLGKVTVIKTLALPKLIHLLTSLPNLKQSLFNDLNKVFFNFIWDGKPEKIKRNTLIYKGKSSIDTKLSKSRDKHSFIFNFTSGFAKYKLFERWLAKNHGKKYKILWG